MCNKTVCKRNNVIHITLPTDSPTGSFPRNMHPPSESSRKKTFVLNKHVFEHFLVLIKLCHFATLPLMYTFETEIVFCVCPAVYGSTRSLLLTDELENTCHPWTGLAFFSSARNPFALSVETPIRYEKNMRLDTYNHFAIMLKLAWKQ